ncbi:hypothetical protein AB0C33_15625 [Nonomuraea sp. NPDC048881]|uniref:hypothetical protein n=1 Tax=Nonomuraea sp. NPDC048881 TaxID=3155030 RepID=UPI0033D866C5
MDHHRQSGPLPPIGEADSSTPAWHIGGNQAGQERHPFDRLIAEKITAARHAFYTAAAKAIFTLQNGRRLSSEKLFAAAYTQASRAWWDLVDEEITGKKLASDHALRRVRSWARHYLTGEPPAALPGTLFDHALAHASRIAARDFLTASGQLLIQHLAESGDGADVPASGMPLDNHDPASTPPNPVVLPAVPSATADAL